MRLAGSTQQTVRKCCSHKLPGNNFDLFHTHNFALLHSRTVFKNLRIISLLTDPEIIRLCHCRVTKPYPSFCSPKQSRPVIVDNSISLLSSAKIAVPLYFPGQNGTVVLTQVRQVKIVSLAIFSGYNFCPSFFGTTSLSFHG